MVRKNHRDSTPGGSQRQLRVGELVRHAMSDMLTRGAVHDPVLEGHLITVPEVRMSADLRLATIYVMPLGGPDADAVLAALERNKRFVRGEVARTLGEGIGLLLDAGLTRGGPPSTIVDVTVSPPTLVRAGAVQWEAIEACLFR